MKLSGQFIDIIIAIIAVQKVFCAYSVQLCIHSLTHGMEARLYVVSKTWTHNHKMCSLHLQPQDKELLEYIHICVYIL